MLHLCWTWPGFARDTCEALAQISAHDSLLSDEWRAWLHDSRASLEHVDDDETGVLAVRAARATAVIAASECARSARWAAGLMVLGEDELDRVQGGLETCRRSLEGELALSLTNLDSAIDDLAAEARAQLLTDPRGGTTGRAARYQRPLGQDLAAAYGDRVEAILLDLGEAV